MSLLGKVFKAAGKVVKSALPLVPGPIGTIAKTVAGITAGTAAIKTIGSVGKTLPAIGSIGKAVLPGIGKVAKVAGAAATGYAIYDAAGNFLGNRKRSRRINPMNYRAANRALKRIEKAKKLMDRLGRITIRKEKC